MKAWKLVTLVIAVTLSLVLFAGCSSSQRYNDGVYYAEAKEFPASGWKEVVALTIEGGKITKVDWDCIYKDDSIPIRKKQYSKSGLYGMLKGGAANEWYDQAIAAEKFVLENGIEALIVDDEGYTDAVSGCTIHVSGLEELLLECLLQAQKK